MSILNGFKRLFGFGTPSMDTTQQLLDVNPTTGNAMVSGTLYDIGGNNIGTSQSSNSDDLFNSGSAFDSFDMNFGSSDFDSF